MPENVVVCSLCRPRYAWVGSSYRFTKNELMSHSKRISSSLSTCLVRAVAEACASSSDPRERLARAASVACSLVGARLGSVCSGEHPAGDSPLRLYWFFETGYWTETDRRVLADYFKSDDHERDLMVQSIADLHRQQRWDAEFHLAISRQQLVDNRRWYGSEHVNDFRRGSDMDDCIYATISSPSKPGRFWGLTFHRPWNGGQFKERDRVLVEIFSRGVAPLLYACDIAGKPVRALDSLPPRLNEVSKLLQDGLSHKQIAFRTGLSVLTVRTHVRNLYAKLGVRSRGEFSAFVAKERERG